jgi:2-dehydropantoate 2-reductase
VRVAIVGAGAIGSAYAWFLARAGHEVGVLDVRGDHIDAIRRNGLVAEFGGASHPVAVDVASTEVGDLPKAELVLVATKAFATAAAAPAAAQLLDDAGWVLTLQNGLGNDRALAATVGGDRVLAGATVVGAELVAPGRVVLGKTTAAGGSVTTIGPAVGSNAVPPAVERIAGELTAAGLPTQVLDEVGAVIWGKLARAGSMAPISSVLCWTVAEVLASPPALALVRASVEEIVAVASATGVRLDLEATWQLCLETFEAVGPHRTSMAVDLEAGRRTEVEAMCGGVARLGVELGVPTPVNGVVAELVRALELAQRASA